MLEVVLIFPLAKTQVALPRRYIDIAFIRLYHDKKGPGGVPALALNIVMS